MSAERLISSLTAQGLTVATAESCTGGLLAGALTAVPGSSAVFGYGVVTYSNAAKTRLLDVPEQTLASFGAVSEQTARAMIQGLLRLSGADLALATTGVAGPGGGTTQKPVGLVYVAAGRGQAIRICRCHFSGNREEIRQQSVEKALELALALAEDEHEK